MRGRLICPFLVGVAQLDTTAETGDASDPDGAGPMTSGYDDDFKEPIVLGTGAGPGAVERIEKAEVRIPAQIEQGEWLKLQAFFNGDSPDTKIVIISHFKYLEEAGLVDADGSCSLRIGDRMTAIYDLDGNVVATIKDPVYVTQVQPGGFGIGRSRNLAMIYFDSRAQGVST